MCVYVCIMYVCIARLMCHHNLGGSDHIAMYSAFGIDFFHLFWIVLLTLLSSPLETLGESLKRSTMICMNHLLGWM